MLYRYHVPGGSELEGVYRIHGRELELLESFVAAPGPAGWRYFGRIYAPESEDQLSTVDFVVDTEWRLVRYRERHSDHGEVVVVPGANGLEATWVGTPIETTAGVPEAEVVWSSSPCSLLVAERRARVLGLTAMRGIRIDVPADAAQVSISLDRVGYEAAHGRSVEKVQVRVDGRSISALLGEDLPVSAEGWFDLTTDAG